MGSSVASRLDGDGLPNGHQASRLAGPAEGSTVVRERRPALNGPGGRREQPFHLYWDPRRRVLLRTR
jgi:hypothetical protein